MGFQMSKQKHVIRFNVEVTENSSFMLEVEIKELNNKNVEQLANEQALRLKDLGYFDDFTSIRNGAIKFSWQGWIS